MPALAFLAIIGLVLAALLFVADATLESGSPAIVTSSRVGLPEPWRPDTVPTLTTTPAPAPDMSSTAVLGAQPSRSFGEDRPGGARSTGRSATQKEARHAAAVRPPAAVWPRRQTFRREPIGRLLNQLGAKAREFLAGDRA